MLCERDLSKLNLRCSNDQYDFYVSKKKEGSYWYVYAIVKGTNLSTTMVAGFLTRKTARECAETWSGWMK